MSYVTAPHKNFRPPLFAIEPTFPAGGPTILIVDRGIGPMTARAHLLGSSYDPETIRTMLAAFDAAWALVHFHFYDSPDTFECARLRLANAILLAAAENCRDVEQLKAAGLATMAHHYRLAPGDFGLEAIMPQRVNNPRYWRAYADATRTIAEQMQDPECKRMLLEIAETYAALARRALEDEANRANKVAKDR